MIYIVMWESFNYNNNRFFFWNNVSGVGDFFDMKWGFVFFVIKGEMIIDWIFNDLEKEENGDIRIIIVV